VKIHQYLTEKVDSNRSCQKYDDFGGAFAWDDEKKKTSVKKMNGQV